MDRDPLILHDGLGSDGRPGRANLRKQRKRLLAKLLIAEPVEMGEMEYVPEE